MAHAVIWRSFLVFVCFTSGGRSVPATLQAPLNVHAAGKTQRASASLSVAGTVTSRASVRGRPDGGGRSLASMPSALLVDAPTFDPPAGTYAAGQVITIATDTPDAVITYTLDGSDPTATDPALVSGGTIVAGHFTLKAKAWKTGDTPSATTTATYTVTGRLTPATLAAGNVQSFAVRSDGVAWAWGGNDSSRLGVGLTAARVPWPAQVDGVTGVTQMAARGAHTLARRTDGTVIGWGSNTSGQIGDGTLTNRPLAVPASGLSSITAVTVGTTHSLALKSDGTVWSFGANHAGQLGDGTTTGRSTPAAIAGLTTVTAIAAGGSFSLALKADGTVWSWGANGNGELGDGTLTPRLAPVAVTGLTQIVAIAAGTGHSLAVKNDGTVLAWGHNPEGQVGPAATSTQQRTPVVVTGLSGVVAVSAGSWHSLVLKNDATVWAWGSNATGQLGDGTTQDRVTPAPVLGLPAIVRIAAGAFHSLALTADEVVWAWGQNTDGPIGDGTTLTRLWPRDLSDVGLVWRTATPAVTPAAGTFTSVVSVTVTVATPGATIHYTTTGVDPTESNPTVASGGSISIAQSLTLKVKAWRAGRLPSPVDDAVYTLRVATPTLTPGGGTYAALQTVTVTCAVVGATLRYTTTGDDPTDADAVIASGSTVTVDRSLTLKVRGWKTGWSVSTVAVSTYTLKAATPVMTPGGGTYAAAQTVTLTTTSPGTRIHYTTNGIEPTVADPSVASGGTVTIAASSTLRARVFRDGWTPSDASLATYWLTLGTVAMPTFTPPGGTYTSPQTVAIGSTTPGATIRYTADGAEPAWQSALYAGPVTVATDAVLKARAFKDDWQGSGTGAATYTLTLGAVSTPTFSPAGGPLASARPVAVSASTPGATIHYTLNGLEPTESDPVVASGATLLIDQALRLTVRAWKAGLPASGIARADYWFVGAVAAGGDHTLVLDTTGHVWAFGRNDTGQLGDGTAASSRPTPVQVAGLSDVIAVAAGTSHSLALTRDGTVVSWGANGSGQLGDHSTQERRSPVAVVGLTDIVAIAAGENHSLALHRDGTLRAWGGNASFQLGLGDGTTTSRTTPVIVPNLTGIVAIGAGSRTSAVVRTDGTTNSALWLWGNNLTGQLADGTIVTRARPARSLTEVRSVALGLSHAVWVTTTGGVTGAGANGVGQLGDGTQTPRLTPTAALTEVPVIAVAAGREHTLSLAVDGTVWGSGQNTFGQAGDEAQVSTLVRRPTRIVGAGTEVIAIAAGGNHSVALTRFGQVLTWGRNTHGQLGDATTTDRSGPIPVPGFSALDNAWLSGDHDSDGLSTWRELSAGTDPRVADTNGDGLLDGVAVDGGLDALGLDVDGDGVLNATEVLRGTDPRHVDSDRDTVPDGLDAFPLDPTRSQGPQPVPGDLTPPVITLTYPTGAIRLPPP